MNTYNDYPIQIVNQIIKEETEFNSSCEADTNKLETKVEQNVVTLCLPYMGGNGEKVLNKMRKSFNRRLKDKLNLQIIYNSKKLSEAFSLKDNTALKHQHNVVYYAKCPNKKCTSTYIGETKRRLEVRVIDHNKRDKKSHLHVHAENTRHKRIWMDNFKVLGNGYKSDFKRRISEAIYIRRLNPDLNKKKEAYKLSLFH